MANNRGLTGNTFPSGNMKSGWEKLGYGLSGGFKQEAQDKAYLQQLEYEYRNRVSAMQEAQMDLQYNQETGVQDARPGSEREFLEAQLTAMTNDYNQLNNQLLIKDQSQAVDDIIFNGNFKSFNNLIATNPKQKDLFNKLGVQGIEKLNVLNPEHIDSLAKTTDKQAVDTMVARYSPLQANIRNAEGLLMGAMGSTISAQEEEQLRKEYDAIGKMYPMVRGTDNNLSMTDLEQFIALSGMNQRTVSQSDVDKRLDFFANSKLALQGINSAVRGENERTLGIANDTAQFKLDGLQQLWKDNPNMTLNQALQVITAQPFQPQTAGGGSGRSFGGTQAELAAEYAQLMVEFNNGTITEERMHRLEAIRAQIMGTEFSGQTHLRTNQDALIIDYNNANGTSVTTVADIDPSRLNMSQRNWMTQNAQQEYKKYMSSQDRTTIDAYNAAVRAASKIDFDLINKSTGLLDASVNTLMDWTGINRDIGDVDREVKIEAVNSLLRHALYGSQVTEAEFESIIRQFGSIFQSDSTFLQKFINTLETTFSKVEKFRTIAPNYYAINMNNTSKSMQEVINALKTMQGGNPDKGAANRTANNTSKTQPNYPNPAKFKDGTNIKLTDGTILKLVNGQWEQQ